MLRNLLALGLWLGVSSAAFAQQTPPPSNFVTLCQSMWAHSDPPTFNCQSDIYLLGSYSDGDPVGGLTNWYNGYSSWGGNSASQQGLCEAFALQHFRWPVPGMRVEQFCVINVNFMNPDDRQVRNDWFPPGD